MKIYLEEAALPEEALLNDMEEAADLCAKREGIDPDDCQVSLSFVTEEEIRTLNRDFRGMDKVTDVLSFPQFEPGEIPEDGEILLGDVVICGEMAEKQAKEYGHSVRREMIYLFVHSMFHLLGYDHIDEEEKAEMRKAEEEIMESLGIRRM